MQESNRKVVLIGIGSVGTSFAYSLTQHNIADELVIIDLNQKKALGEAKDLAQGAAFLNHKIKVSATDNYETCNNASIVVITAGFNQHPGETRLDLIKKNSVIFKEIVTKVMKSGFKGLFLVATNPVDILTYYTWKISGLPHHKVIGSGTTLDTARLKFLIGQKLNINVQSIHAGIIGEHGDSSVATWHGSSIGMRPIKEFLSKEEMDDLHQGVIKAAYEIIQLKGATNHAIGLGLTNIVDAIFQNSSRVLNLSSYLKKFDVYTGYPSIITNDGVREVIEPNLSDEELSDFMASVEVIKKTISSLDIEIE